MQRKFVVPLVRKIDQLTDEQLKEHGFYKGAGCIHGHNIRNIEDEYCYHCIQEIASNSCGFDVNYLMPDFKIRFLSFLSDVDVQGINDCWQYHGSTTRIKFPSYRSNLSGYACDNVTPAKVMFTAAWGDIGKLRIKRNAEICEDPNCVNPLHWSCVANIPISPKTIIPLVTELDFAKIKTFREAWKLGRLQELRKRQKKQCIIHPTLVKNNGLE